MRVQILRSLASLRASGIEESWKALCRTAANLELLYQSPEWFEHVAARRPGARQFVAVARDEGGAVVGVVPLQREATELDFAIGTRSFGRIQMPSLVLRGGEPLVPSDTMSAHRLLTALVDECGRHELLVFPMLPRESPFRKHLDAWLQRRPDLFIYTPATPGAGVTHSLTLETTFETYLNEHFDSKPRRNVNRQIKQLGEQVGALRLQRYCAPDDVVRFLAEVKPVAETSWQHNTVGPHFDNGLDWEGMLRDLAARRILRSYILFAGDRACAFVLGYQYGDVFYYVKTGYDRSLAKRAPGIALLCLLLEELGHDGRRVRINYGFGDADYKRKFGNVHVMRDQVLLMRRTAKNIAAWSLHATFRRGVSLARHGIRGVLPERNG